MYNKNTKYNRNYNNYNDYSYKNNTFRDNNSNNYYKHTFINSAKKNINNDTRIDIQKDKKYNYGYPYRQYSQNTYNSGEFQPKKFFGKINFSINDQYRVGRPYDYKNKEKKEENHETEEKEGNSTKQLFYNSKINSSKENNSNLKALD